MKVNIWNIEGYKGFDDYDGVDDNNFSFKVAMDSRFTQEEIEEIFLNRYAKKYRNVSLKATLVEEYFDDKLKLLSDYCWNKNRCEYCELNQNMFEECPYKKDFTEKIIYEDYFAKCEHYSLSIDYVIEKMNK